MPDIAQYNHENMPMKDILAEIREMVSREAQSRYDDERSQAKRELLILRPEARVDLLLQEAEPDIEVVAEAIPPAPAQEVPPSLNAFSAKLQKAIGISDQEALEALIRKVFREEMTRLGD